MSETFEDSCVKSKTDNGSGDDYEEHDPHYDPIVYLPEVEVKTLEEEEVVLVNLRAKIYRYDSNENPPEWKERGTGSIKILHHKVKGTVRIVMRRDKTLKLCANHFITPQMELKPSASSERAWVYSVKADFIDGTVKSHLLAVKFANIENAQKWKDAWDDAKKIVTNCDNLKLNNTLDAVKKSNSTVTGENDQDKVSEEKSSLEVTEKLTTLNIKEVEEEKKLPTTDNCSAAI